MSGSGASGPSIVWLRDDLRLHDNPALVAAAARDGAVVPLYVLDEESDGLRHLGGASRWWLHHSLDALSQAFADLGSPLVLRRGAPLNVVGEIVRETGAKALFWNRRYDAAGIEVDRRIKAGMRDGGLTVESFSANLLHEPWELATGSGQPYRVFTPFWKAARQAPAPRAPLPAPKRLDAPGKAVPGNSLGTWNLLPRTVDWAGGLRETWTPGEAGARARLAAFLDGSLSGYSSRRDRPDRNSTSMLSPHLRFGEIGPVQISHAALARGDGRDVHKFLAEVGWREFSYHLLFHNPDLATRNYRSRFDAMPWRRAPAQLEAWKRGQTGYPVVDAGMRQLWHTGWMHNRVRMVAASLLIKHLLIDWREGEAWFWDTLVDADPANNPASWQWVAGSGADAAPYFRIFNPVLQGEKFDPSGDYVRRWVPEIAKLPDKHLHSPWTASAGTLRDAGVELGRTYPAPIVDHAMARHRALEAFGESPAEG